MTNPRIRSSFCHLSPPARVPSAYLTSPFQHLPIPFLLLSALTFHKHCLPSPSSALLPETVLHSDSSSLTQGPHQALVTSSTFMGLALFKISLTLFSTPFPHRAELSPSESLHCLFSLSSPHMSLSVSQGPDLGSPLTLPLPE